MRYNRYSLASLMLLLTINLFLPIFASMNVTNTSFVLKGRASPNSAGYLLLTEIGYIATPGSTEYLEIYNPTNSTIDLTEYYISDSTSNYWEIVLGIITTSSFDWIYKFPDESTIEPDEYIVVTENNTEFYNDYAFYADFDIFDMVNKSTGTPNFSMTNSGETIILFYWDGVSDLVTDIDIVCWDPDRSDAVDKTGITIDSNFDGDSSTSTYMDDTVVANQSPVSSLAGTGESIHRIDYTEGTEVSSSGNGIFGHDETSEDWSTTWTVASEFEVVITEMPLFLIPFVIDALVILIVLRKKSLLNE